MACSRSPSLRRPRCCDLFPLYAICTPVYGDLGFGGARLSCKFLSIAVVALSGSRCRRGARAKSNTVAVARAFSLSRS